jgi:thiol-disulfide isomerase/thioredoxin
MISIALSLLLAASPSAGERPLPRIELVGFTGTEARALDDYLGQVLLVDFFAHWCAPCARLVPHMNELVEAYGEQGLNVLGVTGDDAATAREWLGRFEARYPHARDAELALQIELGFRPLPFAVLVDPCGVIVWQGNPGDVPMETIEGLLADALPVPAHRWPAAAGAVRAALRERKYAEAERLAQALPERSAEIARLVARIAARRAELLEAALRQEDFLGAEELALELEAGLADGAARARASAVRAEIAAREGARVVLAAQRELRTLWDGVGAVASVEEADALGERIRALSDAHKGTQVERSAGAYLQTISALKSVLR